MQNNIIFLQNFIRSQTPVSKNQSTFSLLHLKLILIIFPNVFVAVLFQNPNIKIFF
jgi:hypothetical protein